MKTLNKKVKKLKKYFKKTKNKKIFSALDNKIVENVVENEENFLKYIYVQAEVYANYYF